jgi:hypothetical protein
MSTRYKRSCDVPTETLILRLEELAHIIAIPGKDIRSEFSMRIPAEVDRDADLVMVEAARRLQVMIGERKVFEIQDCGDKNRLRNSEDDKWAHENDPFDKESI